MRLGCIPCSVASRPGQRPTTVSRAARRGWPGGAALTPSDAIRRERAGVPSARGAGALATARCLRDGHARDDGGNDAACPSAGLAAARIVGGGGWRGLPDGRHNLTAAVMELIVDLGVGASIGANRHAELRCGCPVIGVARRGARLVPRLLHERRRLAV